MDTVEKDMVSAYLRGSDVEEEEMDNEGSSQEYPWNNLDSTVII